MGERTRASPVLTHGSGSACSSIATGASMAPSTPRSSSSAAPMSSLIMREPTWPGSRSSKLADAPSRSIAADDTQLGAS
eukprot:2945848-Prymnesium_polylepis.1